MKFPKLNRKELIQTLNEQGYFDLERILYNKEYLLKLKRVILNNESLEDSEEINYLNDIFIEFIYTVGTKKKINKSSVSITPKHIKRFGCELRFSRYSLMFFYKKQTEPKLIIVDNLSWANNPFEEYINEPVFMLNEFNSFPFIFENSPEGGIGWIEIKNGWVREI